MKITLVCASGITTSILATKLNAYAKEHNYNDFFTATRVSMDAEVLFTSSDVLLIAPQAKVSAEKLRLEAQQRNVPLIFLSEEELVFGKVGSIYQEINRFRDENSEVVEKLELTSQDVFSIFLIAFMRCIPVQLLSLLLFLFFQLFDLENGSVILSIFPFYLAFAIGYEYGNNTEQSALSMGLLFMASSAFILQINHVQLIGEGITGLREGFIPLMPSTITSYLLVLLVSFLTMLIVYFSKIFFFRGIQSESQVMSNFVRVPIINGIVFAGILIFRLLFLQNFH